MNIPLNIDIQQILLHLFNFALLAAGLTFLLFEPVRKFMEKRRSYYEELEKTAAEKAASAAAREKEYAELIRNADEEIRRKNSEADEKIRQKIQERDDENALILSKTRARAEKEADAIKKEAVDSIKEDTVGLAVAIASGILEREITEKEDAEIIDKCLDEWSEE